MLVRFFSYDRNWRVDANQPMGIYDDQNPEPRRSRARLSRQPSRHRRRAQVRHRDGFMYGRVSEEGRSRLMPSRLLFLAPLGCRFRNFLSQNAVA